MKKKPEQTPAKPTYQGFYAVDRTKRVELRRSGGAWHCPSYAYLLDIVTDGEQGKEIALLFSFMLVKIRGRNLRKLIIALQKSECAFIQEYDPQFFAEPEPDEAVIENIEIVVQEKN